MGTGRDKRKKAKGTHVGQGGVKTAKKTEKNEAKATRRAEKRAEVRFTQPGIYAYGQFMYAGTA